MIVLAVDEIVLVVDIVLGVNILFLKVDVIALGVGIRVLVVNENVLGVERGTFSHGERLVSATVTLAATGATGSRKHRIIVGIREIG